LEQLYGGGLLLASTHSLPLSPPSHQALHTLTVEVRGKIRDRVRLNNGHDGHAGGILSKECDQRVNILALVLGNAVRAVPAGIVVTRTVRIRGAANLAI